MTVAASIPSEFFTELRAYAGRRWPVQPQAAEWMLLVMMSESGLVAGARNSIGCGGLIGFCPPFPNDVDPSTLGYMDQLALVERFWSNPALDNIDNAANLYQFNFVPASLHRGTSLGTVIVAKGGTGYGGAEGAFYSENAMLDQNHDGKITVGDLQRRLDSPQVRGSQTFAEALARLRAAPIPSRFSWPEGLALALLTIGAVGSVLYLTSDEGAEMTKDELAELGSRAVRRAIDRVKDRLAL